FHLFKEPLAQCLRVRVENFFGCNVVHAAVPGLVTGALRPYLPTPNPEAFLVRDPDPLLGADLLKPFFRIPLRHVAITRAWLTHFTHCCCFVLHRQLADHVELNAWLADDRRLARSNWPSPNRRCLDRVPTFSPVLVAEFVDGIGRVTSIDSTSGDVHSNSQF